MRPVIQTGALQVAVVDGEAERVHQVEHRVRCPAEAGDGTGVGRDLGFDEDDVQVGSDHGWRVRVRVRGKSGPLCTEYGLRLQIQKYVLNFLLCFLEPLPQAPTNGPGSAPSRESRHYRPAPAA